MSDFVGYKELFKAVTAPSPTPVDS
jgi:hypothetical protein